MNPAGTVLLMRYGIVCVFLAGCFDWQGLRLRRCDGSVCLSDASVSDASVSDASVSDASVSDASVSDASPTPFCTGEDGNLWCSDFERFPQVNEYHCSFGAATVETGEAVSGTHRLTLHRVGGEPIDICRAIIDFTPGLLNRDLWFRAHVRYSREFPWQDHSNIMVLHSSESSLLELTLQWRTLQYGTLTAGYHHTAASSVSAGPERWQCVEVHVIRQGESTPVELFVDGELRTTAIHPIAMTDIRHLDIGGNFASGSRLWLDDVILSATRRPCAAAN